jgi:hypothetical protein
MASAQMPLSLRKPPLAGRLIGTASPFAISSEYAVASEWEGEGIAVERCIDVEPWGQSLNIQLHVTGSTHLIESRMRAVFLSTQTSQALSSLSSPSTIASRNLTIGISAATGIASATF